MQTRKIIATSTSALALMAGAGLTGAGLTAPILTTPALADPAKVKVEVVDKTFDTAGSFLAYTEFELSGEPLAEALGLDLDVLDPNQVNQPTEFDYAAGIESYEYSEEAMYAVNYQSRMGPHIANGPVNASRASSTGGSSMESLGKRVIELSQAVAFPAEEIPLNMYPLSFPYAGGLPEYGQKVDTATVNGDKIELLDARGEAREVETVVPAFFRDYKTLAWREDSMDKAFTPAAAGAQMLKDVMWSQDFLGGMHTIKGDEEVEADSAAMDQDGVHALGVSSADGFNGVILTEITWDKLLTLQEKLGYDGATLGAAITPDYDPAKGAVWFPHRVSVTEAMENGVKAIGALKVEDGRSTLRDSWMLLWPVSEFYAFSDQRPANAGQNPAFKAVFDNAPFPAAPDANLNAERADDVKGDDPFSIASNLSGLLFKNLEALHFNAETGTLVDSYDGKQGTSVTTYDAAYALVALNIFQRAQDALPVGYAAADAGESLATAEGQRALAMIAKQADFILAKLIGDKGLAVDRYDLAAGKGEGRSVGTQFAVIRGLTAAFQATGDARYKEAARQLFIAVEAEMYDEAVDTYADQPGQPTEHTPWTAAAISSGLRSLMLSLRNAEGESAEVLELGHLAERYTAWFHGVINGRNAEEGMQLAEWLGDSGENLITGDDSGDSDRDGVALITEAGGEHGTAMVMAGKVKVSAE